MVIRLKDTAKALGFKNAKELALRSKLPLNTVYPLWNGTTKRIDLTTLDRLCDTLNVPVGMIIEHRPDVQEVAR